VKYLKEETRKLKLVRRWGFLRSFVLLAYYFLFCVQVRL